MPLVGVLRQVAEELQLPIEQLEETHVFAKHTLCEVSAQILVQLPVNVPPLGDGDGEQILARVTLGLLDAVEEDHLETRHAEEGH